MTPTTPTQGEMRLVPADSLPKVRSCHFKANQRDTYIAAAQSPVAIIKGKSDRITHVLMSVGRYDAILSVLHASPDKMEKGHD